jgi:hypothetical protein
MIWHPSEWSTTVVRQGRTYLDGERIDGTTTRPNQGWQLLEVALGTRTAHAANFFNDRNIITYGKRVGGDNLCEALIFTNHLSETDRLCVQHYLRQKWLAPEPIDTLSGADVTYGTIITEVAGGSEISARLNGRGTIQKEGEGTTLLEDHLTVESVFRSASLLSGILDAHIPVPLSLTAGDRVTAVNTALTVTHDAGSNRIIKDGSGYVTLSSIPQDVSHLSVNAGTLILTTPSTDTSFVTETSGSITNASFEQEQVTVNRRIIPDGTTYFGWTAFSPPVAEGAGNDISIFNRNVATTSLWPCNYDAPDGNQVLAMKRDSSVTTTLTLPVAGVYDISFYTSGRTNYGNHEFDLCILNGTDTNRVATVQTTPQPYERQTFRLPWLAAGEHTLLLHRNGLGVDSLGTVDDFSVRLFSEVPSDSLKIFNGDFELTGYPRNPTAFATSNFASGWVFSSTNNVVTAGITMSASSSAFYTPSAAYGSVQLGIYSNGFALSTMTLPAGTYQLQADICNWNCNLLGKYLYGTQQLKATITRTSGENIDLGTKWNTGSILSATMWPTAFAVTNNETVTLTLAGQAARAGMLVDNLVLLPQTESIIQNGGFESGNTAWNLIFDQSEITKMNATISDYTSSTIYYGYTFFEGAKCLRLTQTGAAVQTVTFDEPGTYCLTFHAISRVDHGDPASHGQNPVAAWISRAGVTNQIGYVNTYDAFFRRHEFYFKVAAAGSYDIGLQGQDSRPNGDQTAIIDVVSVEKVESSDAGALIPESATLDVAADARLYLNYTGTVSVDTIRYGGHTLTGIISSETYPEFIYGSGELYSTAKGTLILLR